MSRRKKFEPEEPRGCPDWMVTFSDVVSLLVTFFVLILTFSTLEVETFQRLAGALRGGFGVLGPEYETNRTVLLHRDALRTDRSIGEGSTIPFVRSVEDLEEDLEDLQFRSSLGKELKIDRIDGALRIRIQGDRLFDPGSDAIRVDFIPVIKELRDVLGYYPNDILVEGHTDSNFTGSSRYPTGFELAGVMARKVAEALLDEGAIKRKRVGTASYGSTKPITTNRTSVGRAKNRRVDILIFEDRSSY